MTFPDQKIYRQRMFFQLLMLLLSITANAQLPFEPGDFADRDYVIKSNRIQKRTGYLIPDSNLIRATWVQNHIQLDDSVLYSETFYSKDGFRTKEITYSLNGQPRLMLNYNTKQRLTSKIVYLVNDSSLLGYVYLYDWERNHCAGVDLYYGFTRSSQLDSILKKKAHDFPVIRSHVFEHDKIGRLSKSIPAKGYGDTNTLYFEYNRFNELTGVYATDINHWSVSFEYDESGKLIRYFGNGNPGISYIDDVYFYYDHSSLLARSEIAGTGVIKYYYFRD